MNGVAPDVRSALVLLLKRVQVKRSVATPAAIVLFTVEGGTSGPCCSLQRVQRRQTPVPPPQELQLDESEQSASAAVTTWLEGLGEQAFGESDSESDSEDTMKALERNFRHLYTSSGRKSLTASATRWRQTTAPRVDGQPPADPIIACRVCLTARSAARR
jgi:hypothetical protein